MAWIAVFLASAATRGWAQTAPGGEFQVNSYTTGDQGGFSGPGQVAGSGDGRFVVVWRSAGQGGPNAGVFGQRYLPNGAADGPEFQVNTTTTTDHAHPAVAARADHGSVVVWEEADGSGAGIRGQLYGDSGLPIGTGFQVNVTTVHPQTEPAVSMDAAGRFVVVWRNLSIVPGPAFVSDIFGRLFDSDDGTPMGAEFTVNSTSSTTDLDLTPSVAANAAGQFVVVWTRGTSGQARGIYGRRYDSTGTAQGAEFLVNSFTGSSFIQDPSVAMDDSGAFVVAWSTIDGPGGLGWDVFARRFDAAGTAQGADFLVNTDFILGNQLRPDVARDADGSFVVVWTTLCQSCTAQDGTQRAILGRRYFGNGTPVDAEFVVNTYTTGDQENASVAITRAGDFVVTWDSAGQDGSGYGVFAQQYNDVIFRDGFES